MPSLDASVGGDDAFEIESIEAIAVAEAPVGEAAVADAPVASTAASSAPAVAKPAFDFSNLALAPMDGAAEPASTAAASTGAADAAPVMQPTAAGAVVILAGLGGPDAVRQLLSSLPEQLSVPVLLYQHLEVGKHERLVDQLAKISRLPVQLAREGASPAAGTVWLLPANMTAGAHGDSLVFEPGVLAQLIAALPPEGSMVVVLSGADPQLVPMILEMGEAGGLVLAQDPEVCFDAAAAEAMQRQGAAVFPALGLARQIATRWPVAA
jgi:chemotaxis response regulator CheB